MLSLFPSLLSFQLLSPFIIRITLGVVFVYWSYRSLKKIKINPKQKTVSVIEGISGILLILGLWTQLAALVIFINLAIRLYYKFKTKSLFTEGINYYFILLILSISLLFTGAGFLAFDLPI